MNDVQVLLVTYNSGEFIGAAVESCLRQRLRVLVVDNASTDATLTAIPDDPRVRVIANRENRGFAGAVNQGVGETNASLLLLLNPDAVLLTSTPSSQTDTAWRRVYWWTATENHKMALPSGVYRRRRHWHSKCLG